MNKVLITGASGFIGRNCLRPLVEKGYEVHAVSRQVPPSPLPAGVIWHRSNILEPGSPTSLVRKARPEALLHLAWYAEPGKFWESPENLEWVRATLELFGAFSGAGGRRIVAAGSCAEYGSATGECREDLLPAHPTTLYGASKQAVERILHFWGPQARVSFAWGRIFFVYGPHEHPSRVVAYVIRSLLRHEPALCSKGTQVLDFLHVADVGSAFVSLLEHEVSGPVNIGSGNPTPLRGVLEEIGRQLGQSDLIHFGAQDTNQTATSLWANTERLVKGTGWRPHYDLSGGIAQTIEWWRRQL